MNISEFMQWFINQFVNIATQMLGKLDDIIIYGNVSLMDFIITIAIIGAFITIIITTPSLGVVQRDMNKKDREARREARANTKKNKGKEN